MNITIMPWHIEGLYTMFQDVDGLIPVLHDGDPVALWCTSPDSIVQHNKVLSEHRPELFTPQQLDNLRRFRFVDGKWVKHVI